MERRFCTRGPRVRKFTPRQIVIFMRNKSSLSCVKQITTQQREKKVLVAPVRL